MQSKGPEKASKYISALYEARCNERWQAIPELARKVEKHAPARKGLTLAARAEAQIHTQLSRESFIEVDRRHGESLLSASHESADAEDALDAAIMLASINYIKGMPEVSLQQVAESLHDRHAATDGATKEAWNAVCTLHGTLIRGLSFEARGGVEGATSTYRSIMPYLASVTRLKAPCRAMHRATEELTTHICLYFSTSTERRKESMNEAMAAYHVQSKLLQRQNGKFLVARGLLTRNTPRHFWRAYYTALSQLVKDGLVYYSSPLDREHGMLAYKGLLDDDEFAVARRQQRNELRRIEQSYETILMEETKFPKASQVNEEMKTWVELAFSNWLTLCGSSWTEAELGAGGKLLVGRDTLDILYRAQTKTFHSTQILRHLITVHIYVADFDLAMKAFEAYTEILTKGKARVKKSGSAGLDLDEDDVALRLASEVVRVACRYGSEQAAEKALHVGMMIQQWLERGTPDTGVVARAPTLGLLGAEREPAEHSSYSEDSIGDAYRSLGISQSTWSRYTYDPEIRRALQERAVQNLRASLRFKSVNAKASETLFALGMTLAEMRRADQALSYVQHDLEPLPTKNGNASPPGETNGPIGRHTNYSSKADDMSMMPMRHLHALVLAAAEDYEGSFATCNAALERAAGLGIMNSISTERSKATPVSFRNVQESMKSYDKQNALQLKMTQISLLKVTTSAEEAVNCSNELIGLYVDLFGPIKFKKAQQPTQDSHLPPRSSSGTIKSIFSRKRRSHRAFSSGVPSANNLPSTVPSSTHAAVQSRPVTVSQPPAINVIVESEKETNEHSNHTDTTAGAPKHLDEKQQTPERQPSLRDKALGSLRSNKGSPKSRRNVFANGEKGDEEAAPVTEATDQVNGDGAQVDASRFSRSIPHNMPPGKTSPPTGHADQPPKQDTRLPVTLPSPDNSGPSPVFLTLQESKFKMSLLVSVWLFVAKLYAESDMHTDASEAVDEAFDLVQALESEVAQDSSSLRAFQDRGWGGGKSVEDLWADICAAKGELYQVQGRPHDALIVFEQALTHSLNHPAAIVGLGTILLDIYTQKIPSEKPAPNVFTPEFPAPSSTSASAIKQSAFAAETLALYRLAARDRAYALLSSLVRTYGGHALPEAWVALARAYELSGQIEEAKEALWKAIELEDTTGVRPWGEVFRVGGFVLR